MIIRKLEFGDLVHIARIHKDVYGAEHFTSCFSEKHLVLFYRIILKYNSSHSFGCFDSDGSMLGFAVAGCKTGVAEREFIRLNPGKIIFYLISHPTHLLSKLKAIFAAKSPVAASRSSFRLLSIATTRNYHSRGVAKKLVAQLLSVSPTGNLGLSVKKSNVNAIKAYERIGFSMEYSTPNAVYYVIEKKQ